ncbi:MAG: cupin domain-containing protein [Acidimicrobiales bacterium]
MRSQPVAGPGSRAAPADADGATTVSNGTQGHGQLGSRLRQARQAAHLGVRELARQLELSASLISQIELGRVVPSVSTLYALTTALGVSMDSLFGEGDGAAAGRPWSSGQAPRREREGPAREQTYIQRRDSRRSIELEQGVRWELLTPSPEPGAEFLEVTYPVGGSSSPTNHAIRHNGRDYCLVLDGLLSVQIGFEEFLLSAGDSLAFDGTIPHRFWNDGTEPVRAVWFVLDRGISRN